MNFNLRRLPDPRVPDKTVSQAIQMLREIAERNQHRWGESSESSVFRNAKEALRQQLQKLHLAGRSLESVKKNVGWQRLMLSLYLDEHGEPWMPALDDEIAKELLGASGALMTKARRRMLTRIYFKHFDRLEALEFVTQRLRESYASLDEVSAEDPVAIWSANREVLFQEETPNLVCQQMQVEESLVNLLQRFQLPDEGRLVEQVRQVYLLQSLRNCSFGTEPTTLKEIKKCKEQMASRSLRIGAAALQILVDRVQHEGSGRWPEAWQKWIVELGCDPRLGRASAEATKWWGWATDAQVALATRGVIGLSLKLFFEFLDGTVTVQQWQERRAFLEELFDSGKIIDAKLLLNHYCYGRLSPDLRDRRTAIRLRSTTDNTCVIALKCVDDVFILEGTYSYGLRAFHKNFPIRNFWDGILSEISDFEVRISPISCPIFVRHQGSWIQNFARELRSKFHVEWRFGGRRYTPPPVEHPTPTNFTDNDPKSKITSYLQALRRSTTGGEYLGEKESVYRALFLSDKIREVKHWKWNSRDYLAVRCVDGVTLLDASQYINVRVILDDEATWERCRHARAEEVRRLYNNATATFAVSFGNLYHFKNELRRELIRHGITWNLN